MLKTPVLFLIFNRPELTLRVFEEIRKAQPAQLFIAADGPRDDKEGEAEKCLQARSIVNKIDWKCEVKTLFREKNLGCSKAPSSAITWFFENVDEGIILEDDCLPDQSFFTFCDSMLNKYRYNEKIMHISGNNFQDGKKRGDGTYYFSKYTTAWGWATWKRAWEKYDITLSDLSSVIPSNEFKKYLPKFEYDYWINIFIESKEKRESITWWDYQWLYCVWKNNGIVIIPNFNLVKNIGFGIDATHTFAGAEHLSINVQKIDTIVHPIKIKIDKKADRYYFFRLRGYSNYFSYIQRTVKKKIINLLYSVYLKFKKAC